MGKERKGKEGEGLGRRVRFVCLEMNGREKKEGKRRKMSVFPKNLSILREIVFLKKTCICFPFKLLPFKALSSLFVIQTKDFPSFQISSFPFLLFLSIQTKW